MEEESSAPECRICRGNSPGRGPLVSPCACRGLKVGYCTLKNGFFQGTLRFVHERCLLEWVNSSANEANLASQSLFVCELCRSPMRIKLRSRSLVWMFISWKSTLSWMRLRGNGVTTVLFLLSLLLPQLCPTLPSKGAMTLFILTMVFWVFSGCQMVFIARQISANSAWAAIFQPQLFLLLDGLHFQSF